MYLMPKPKNGEEIDQNARGGCLSVARSWRDFFSPFNFMYLPNFLYGVLIIVGK